MKPKLKKIWIKALRSGEYKQTKKKLCDKDGYCCLGVAYDVLSDGDWIRRGDGGVWAIRDEDSWEFREGFPPLNVLDKWGLEPDQASDLASRNDNGWTFGQIVDWIEDNL